MAVVYGKLSLKSTVCNILQNSFILQAPPPQPADKQLLAPLFRTGCCGLWGADGYRQVNPSPPFGYVLIWL